jgi:phosphoribosylaminoimidazolecarboxamide formyltransferase/IMP cyclohydrolase
MTVDESESSLYKHISLSGNLVYRCAYGENRWQSRTGLYDTWGHMDVLALPRFQQVEGATLSYNNWADIDRLLQTITHIAAVYEKIGRRVPFIAVGVKHGNACGAGVGPNPLTALTRILAGDKLAIFGGVVMTNFPITMGEGDTLREWGTTDGVKRILDCVIAPSFDEDGKRELTRKGGKCRMVVNPALADIGLSSLDTAYRVRQVRGGFLAQPNYTFVPDLRDRDLVEYAGFPQARMPIADLALAWAVGSTSNSNTITLVKDGTVIANAVGQQDRVGAVQLALMRAYRSGHVVRDAVAYSDSFFPFTDAPNTLADAGVRSILATKGSLKDDDVRRACLEHRVSLYLIDDAVGRGFFGH